MTLLATEAAFSGLTAANSDTSGVETSVGLLQEFIKDPLHLIYKLYHSSTTMASMEDTEAHLSPSFTDAASTEDTPSLDTPTQSRRLHPIAETYRSSLMAGTASVLLKRSGGDSNSIPQLEDLPIPILLHIASFMDAKSLCQLQQTNKFLYSLMGDELLWRRKLLEDSRKWSIMSHLSHPRVYEETDTDKTAQEM